MVPRRIGLVTHPTRDIETSLVQLMQWAEAQGVEVGQLPFARRQRSLLDECRAAECDLIVAVGGDGTTLAAIRNGAGADRPVLGIACGSLGALATVPADEVGAALDRVAAGDWRPRTLPALEVRADGQRLEAFNDLVVGRQGEGQVRVSVSVGEVLFARFAGDGCIISTSLGSSAYALAAGGPLLAPDLRAFMLTPLPTHGGVQPPLVVSEAAELRLAVTAGYGGVRYEIDGQVEDLDAEALRIALRPDAAQIVTFADQEPFVSRLRRRGIITDSPRILAEDERELEVRGEER
jgi:NAD+ kinase